MLIVVFSIGVQQDLDPYSDKKDSIEIINL